MQAMDPDTTNHSAYSWFLMLGGVCFLGRAVTALLVGPPPPSGEEILGWIEAGRVAMMWGNEALVIGAGLMLVGVFGFQESFRPSAPVKTTAGSVLFAAGLVLCLMLGIVQGRFVYPIHGLSLSRPGDAELLASLYFGGYHLVALAFAAAAMFWGLAMLKVRGWLVFGVMGFVVAAGSVIASYPDLIGPTPVFVLEAALALWYVAVGWRLRSFE